jgi:hypothetical protein
MMVERSHPFKSIGQFLNNLNNAVDKLTLFNEKMPPASNQEWNEVIKVFHELNSNLDDTSFLDTKKLVPEEMDKEIEKALKAVQLFQLNQPERNKAAQRNVRQAIISLSSALSKEINSFDKKLQNLKKYRIGRKIEKSGESKHTK